MSVNWVVPWNREDARAVAHHNVLALADNAKSNFFQRPYGSLMRNTLNRHSYR